MALIETELLDLAWHLMRKQTGFQYLPCSVFLGGNARGYTVISSFLWHVCSQIFLVAECSLNILSMLSRIYYKRFFTREVFQMCLNIIKGKISLSNKFHPQSL